MSAVATPRRTGSPEGPPPARNEQGLPRLLLVPTPEGRGAVIRDAPDDSMEPTFPKGCMVFVEDALTWGYLEPGRCYFLSHNSTGRRLRFMQLVAVDGERLTFRPINRTKYPTTRLQIERRQLRRIGLAAWVRPVPPPPPAEKPARLRRTVRQAC